MRKIMICFILIFSTIATAQPTFVETIGSTGNECSSYILRRPDGTFLIGGQTRSFGADSTDMLFVFIDQRGDVEQAVMLTASEHYHVFSIISKY